MAFNPERLSLLVQPIGDAGMRWFNYQTDESQATLTGAGFIPNASAYGIRVSDLIFVSYLTIAADPYILVVDDIDADDNATMIFGDSLREDISGIRTYADRATVEASTVPITTDNILVQAYSSASPSAGRANYRAASDADYAATPARLRLTDVTGRKFVINEPVINVTMAGALGDAVTDDVTVFQAAATAGGVYAVPSGDYLVGSGVTAGANRVFWQGGEVRNSDGSAPLSLPGVQELWFQDGKFFYEPLAVADTYATVRIDRNSTYSGGTHGNVASGLKVNHTVSAGVVDFQWAILGALNNSATGGENVAIYGQGWKQSGAGPTWAMCTEARDYNTDPTTGLVSIEIGVFCNGTDANGSRVAAHLPLHQLDPLGSAAICTRAVWVNPNANTQYTKGIQFSGAGSCIAGISFENTMTTGITYGSGSTIALGVDFSLATFSAAPIRLAADQRIQLEGTGVISFGYETAGKITFKNGVTELITINTTTGAMTLGANQVLGQRVTGWTAASGTATRSTFATGSVTTEQLAERVKALIDDLIAHGLIGT